MKSGNRNFNSDFRVITVSAMLTVMENFSWFRYVKCFIGLKKKRLDIEGNLAQPVFSIRIEFNVWFVLETGKVPRKRP
jgi:hypothetical protein